MSSEYTSVELATNTVAETEIKQVEELVNSSILKSLPIKYIQTNDTDINRFQLRRPSKLKGDIRLVNIENYDCVACGGVHLENTRDVKLVKFFKSEKIRGNIRTYWKIGNRAYQDYESKTQLINRLRNVLNSDENNIENKIEQLNIEISNVKSQMNKFKKELIYFYKKDLLSNKQSDKSKKFISKIWDNENGEFILKLLKSMINDKNIIICFINKKNGIFNWLIGCSEDINVDFNEVRKNILIPLNCKGGGQFPIWQGVGTDSDKATDFINKLSENIRK
jgi:alanyl-tRNA synthetase